MEFIYHQKSGAENLKIEGDAFVHLFKSRRANIEKPLFFRNLEDGNLYTYKVVEINKKEAIAELVETKNTPKKSSFLNIAWAVIDPKIVEKTVPFLNEMGVKKIIFIYTKFSQRNFKIAVERLKRVAINSSEQCGRCDLMEFEIVNSLEIFLEKYSDIGVVDFSPNRLETVARKLPNTWLVGCEGGFSEDERERLKNFVTIGFEGENILRSESAVIAIAAKITL